MRRCGGLLYKSSGFEYHECSTQAANSIVERDMVKLKYEKLHMSGAGVLVLIALLCSSAIGRNVDSCGETSYDQEKDSMSHKHHVEKIVLENDMTVLVRPVHTVPKVSIQLWYGVGSRDEHDKERGIAHLIEHMIFKGTNTLSESDIDATIHKLGGDCNAFTSYDYTGYLFNLPSQHWQEAFPIMADCMVNCGFKDDMLNSEMKAVIQELKLYKDRYVHALVEEIIGTIFSDHPYHHPIIGYKQDLWSVSSRDLKSFYKKHYVPNNATLVVVGDVDPKEVFAHAQRYFESIKPNPTYERQENYFNQDLISKSVTLYREVKKPIALYAFVTPGSINKKDHVIDLVAWILGKGKSSRLYKKIVEELQLATSLDVSNDNLFDHSLLFIVCEPKRVEDIPAIEQIIKDEIERIAREGISDEEFTKAIKYAQLGLCGLLEDFESQAYEIGKYFLATGDQDYVFTSLDGNPAQFKKDALEIIKQYLRPAIMHKGFVLPMPDSEQPIWKHLQELSDEEDNRILAARVRTTEVEDPVCALQIEPKDLTGFNFPQARETVLSNGLKILSYRNPNTPKVELILDLKGDSDYDPIDKQGLCRFMAKMLVEGTDQYTAEQFAHEVENRGVSISTSAGTISMSMLADDVDFGLHILSQLVQHATFDEKQLEKVRQQIISQIHNFWDEPRQFASQITNEIIYEGHPYSKNGLGTLDSISSITQKDLKGFYARYMSPYGARLAVVGDFDESKLIALIEKHLGTWKKVTVEDVRFPALKKPAVFEVKHPINRDQIVLTLVRASVDRKHPDYDKLVLFDQVFGGGALGSMGSRLFKLRQQSGLFYGISGSAVAGADEQPGMFMVRTIVSVDRCNEAIGAIKDTIEHAVDSLTYEELEEARRAVESSVIDFFASNRGMAQAFLFIDRYKFPKDYFDKRADVLKHISLEQVKEAAHKIVHPNDIVTIIIGRDPSNINPDNLA